MKRLLSYLKPHKWVMTLATVLVLYQRLLSSVCRSRRFRFGRCKLERSCTVARPGSI